MLGRSSSAVAPAPPSQAQGEAPELQLPNNVDTPHNARNKHFRKTSSWTTEPANEQTSAANDSHSSQPASARTKSRTATSPHSLPPLTTPSHSSVGSTNSANSSQGNNHTITLHPAPTPNRQLPSQSASSANRPSHTRIRSTSTAISVSRLGSSHTPSHHRHASSTATPACKLTLDELLAGSRQYPLSLSEFRRYMNSQYTDEMVEFLLDVQLYKAEVVKLVKREEKERKAGKVSAVAAGGESVEAGVRRVNAEKDRLLQRFLAPGSERQINVSCDMRTAIEQFNQQSYSCSVSPAEQIPATPASTTHTSGHAANMYCGVPLPALLTLFDPAIREVYDLIEQGKFVSRFWHQQTRNIDQHDINVRHVTGTINLTLALALTLALILTSTVRWYRLCAFPFNFYGVTTLLIAHCGVCPTLASLRMRIPDRGGKWGWWAVVRGRCDGDECRVGDVEVVRAMERTARRVWMKALLISSVLTAVYVGVPSHPLT